MQGHISFVNCNDAEFIEVASMDGFSIKLVFQPPSSPDFNTLDLGFFNAIQSLQFKSFSKDLKELISAASFEPKILNYTWLQLQQFILEVMKVKGGKQLQKPTLREEKV